MSDSPARRRVPVREPYRLDLTATVLRRLSTNIVDVFDGQTYRRLLDAGDAPVLVEVIQSGSELVVELTPSGGELVAEAAPSGGERVAGADSVAPIVTSVARMLGTDVDLTHFYAVSEEFGWLAKIVRGARGVKPPRYPSLWEAIVNAVVFQQVSIHAAAAILRRVIERYAPPREPGALALTPFVHPRSIADADPPELRALGLSVNKIVALRTLARAVLAGELDGDRLEALPTDELAAQLVTFKGIGPWTAAVIALRGFGRLDTFPLKDSGVARGLRDLSGEPELDAAGLLAALGPQRGMLYYHLLLGRLVMRGDVVLDGGAPHAGGSRDSA
jgi:DNA-3-methyladenine glycosylase II